MPSVSWFRTSAILLSWLVLCAVVVPLGAAGAETETDDDWTGYYLQGGIVAGFPVARQGNVDFTPGVGVSLTAGVRHSPYIAGELDFSYVTLSDTDDFNKLKGNLPGSTGDSKTLDSFSFTFNLKGYPLSYFDVPLIPDWIEPYLRLGLGLGQTDLDPRTANRFLIPIGTGVDIMFQDRLGVYLDASYTVLTDTATGNKGAILNGQGQLRAGVLVRF